MQSHISELRTFMSKASYEESLKNNPNDTIAERVFPVATTNKIELYEAPLTIAKKLVALLHKEGRCVNYFTVALARSDFDSGNAGNKLYNQTLHANIKSKIRAKLNNTLPSDYIGYEFWYDSDRQDHVVLFINPFAKPSDTAALLEFASNLDDWSDNYSTTQQQKFLNKILNITVKLDFINQHALSIGALSDRQVNLNNDICFLVKQEVKSSTKKLSKQDAGSADGTHIIYHTLAADVWVTNQNEIITTLSYRRYKSSVIAIDGVPTGEIDVIIPNSLPAHYKSFADNLEGNGSQLTRVNAKEGKQKIDFLDLKNLGESGLFYKNQFANMMGQICADAGIDHHRVVFDPELCGRPFVTLARADQYSVRPKVTIIVGIPNILLNQTHNTTATYKYPSQSKNNGVHSTAKDKTFDIPYVVSDVVQAYVEYLKTTAFAAYDVSVVSLDDIEYDDLEYGINYIFLQEPKPPHGYWRVTTKAKEGQLETALGSDWLSKMHLGIVIPDVGLELKHDFIDAFRTREANAQKDSHAPFHTDTYTMWKIHQFEAALKGTPKKSLQGLHIPSFNEVANHVLGHAKFSDASYGVEGFEHANHKKFTTTRQAVYDKINIDLNLKRALATEGVVGLYNQMGELADYSAYKGAYRCYYVVRPKSRGGNGFYASQIDFSFTKDGISIKDIKLLHNDSMIRKSEQFSISKAAVSGFYNEGFYLVNEAGDVLTFYSQKREEQPLASIPQSGFYKDWDMTQFYYYKLDKQDPTNPQPPSISKTITPKKLRFKKGVKSTLTPEQIAACEVEFQANLTEDEKNEHFESLFIPFLTIPSKGIKDRDYAHFPKNPDAKGGAAGGKEWLFLKELPDGELLVYLSTKKDIHSEQSTANRIYKMLVKDKDGKRLNAATSPLAMLYIETTSFHIAKVNDFSSKSMLQSLAKIALKD